MDNARPDRVAERLKDVVIEFGLREARAATETHVITVSEPDLWAGALDDDDPPTPRDELHTEIKEIEI